jgi:hypothetical protein
MTVLRFIGLPIAKPMTACGRGADQDQRLPALRSLT